MKKAVILALIITVSVFLLDQNYSPEDKTEAELVRVIDGDTIKVNIHDRNESVRFIGMDTPEIHGGNNPLHFGLEDTPETEQCLYIWAEKSTSYVKQEVSPGDKIELEFEGDRRDQYGRLRAHIHLQDTNNTLNYKLVEKGYANVFPVEFDEKESFEEAEQKAQEQEKGLWNCRNVTTSDKN